MVDKIHEDAKDLIAKKDGASDELQDLEEMLVTAFQTT